MSEIRNLKLTPADEGAEKSGGQSCNFWGVVKFPEELLAYINEYKQTQSFRLNPTTGKNVVLNNQKAPIWTAFDKYIYSQNGDIKESDLPKISATFKSCFRPYSAVAENLGMKLAMALGQPTSYNYLVSFDPEEYPEIVNNYPSIEKREKLQPYGIVSIDFLQAQHCFEKWGKADYTPPDEDTIEIDSVNDLSCDELLSMEDVYAHCGMRFSDSEEENYIENWIEVVDQFAKSILKDQPREKINKTIDRMHSRIARSFLLREFLGDCDFTAKNTVLVYNEELRELNYAPNHDYGEAFNPVIENLFKKKDKYFGMTEQVFKALPQAVQDKLASQQPKEMSVEEVATQYASASSERNLQYVIENFPDASLEFFEYLDNIISKGEMERIVDSYAGLTCNGEELLKENERETLKQFLTLRANYMCELYVQTMEDLGIDNPFITHSSDDDLEM